MNMQIPCTLPRPRHQDLWDGVASGSLYLTTSGGESGHSNLWERLSQLAHPFPTTPRLSWWCQPPLTSAHVTQATPPAALQPEPPPPFSGVSGEAQGGMTRPVSALGSTPAPLLPLDPITGPRTLMGAASWVGRALLTRSHRPPRRD